MLTPRFKLSQDEDHVFITVHAPYTNIAETEIDIDGENFLFVSSPYFLRLQLPGRIVDNDRSKGSYTCDSGDFTLTFDKESPGENFQNLDMITSLLAPKDIPNVNPDLVEMLEEGGITIEEDSVSVEQAKEEGTGDKHSYGFANKITTEFEEIGNEFPQIFELRVPEHVAVHERNALRRKVEDQKFSSDHYLADFFDKELLAPYLNTTMSWNSPDFDKNIDFTDEEVAILKELPNKHYILSNSEYKQVFYGLVDILFGYCYDKRTTLNDSHIESSWTINKLSSTLSWFCVFNDIQEVLIACYRRSLCYPIFRNFDLSCEVKNDMVSLLRKGKKFTIKCMLSIHQMFNLSNDARYILNQLYIKDYLIFLQKCRPEEFDDLSNNIANVNIKKSNVGFDLVMVETAALLVQKEEANGSNIMENEIAMHLAKMSLLPVSKRLQQIAAEIMSGTDSNDSSSDSSDDSSDLDSDDEPFLTVPGFCRNGNVKK